MMMYLRYEALHCEYTERGALCHRDAFDGSGQPGGKLEVNKLLEGEKLRFCRSEQILLQHL